VLLLFALLFWPEVLITALVILPGETVRWRGRARVACGPLPRLGPIKPIRSPHA
jgi:hypothetical protein